MSTTKQSQSHDANRNGVSYSALAIFFVGFAIGGVAVSLGYNASQARVSEFTTVELLNFVFSIALAAASTALSIIAIILSKKSEEMMLSQSIISKNLQHEIFDKTLEVLGRIESSSGINEKRIDDISKTIKEITHTKNPKVRREIDEALREGFQSTSYNLDFRKSQENEKILAKEQKAKYQNEVLLGVSNIDQVKATKIGDGTTIGFGEQLVDGLYTLQDLKFGVSVFHSPTSSAIGTFDEDTIREYVLTVSREITRGVFNKLFIVSNEISAPGSRGFKESVMEIASLLDEKVRDNIHAITGDARTVLKDISAALTSHSKS